MIFVLHVNTDYRVEKYIFKKIATCRNQNKKILLIFFLSIFIPPLILSEWRLTVKTGPLKIYIYIDVCTCIVFPFAIYSERFQRFPNSFCVITCIYFCNTNEKKKKKKLFIIKRY